MRLLNPSATGVQDHRLGLRGEIFGEEARYQFAGQASPARELSGAIRTKGLVAPTGSAHGTSYSLRGFSPCRLEARRKPRAAS